MKIQEKSSVLILSAVMLTACGGGGGGGAPTLLRTTITGTATPPVAPASGPATASANVVLPAFSSGTWPSIVQGTDYTFVNTAPPGAMPTLKVASMNVRPVDTQTGSTSITTDAAYGIEPTLGQTLSMTNNVGGNLYGVIPTPQAPIPGVLTWNGFAPALDTVNLTGQIGTTTTYITAEYALPNSGMVSPVGYTYQTFGYWASTNTSTLTASEFYFSAGVPTVTTLPTGGTATYNGHVIGSYVDANTRDAADVRATMNAMADFAALTVAFTTSGSTATAPGGMPSANPGLDMTGTLSYAAGNNTFTGAVSTANGMAGNATGRFYGPGIATATATKAAGAPPEIGGTFAVMGANGAMQGAFGGK